MNNSSLTIINPKATTLGGALSNFQVEKPESFKKLNLELLNNSKFQITIDGYQFAFNWDESGAGVGLFLERLADVWQQGKSNRETFPDAISLGFVTNRFYRSFSGLSGNSESTGKTGNKDVKHSLFSYALTLKALELEAAARSLNESKDNYLRLASNSLDSTIESLTDLDITDLRLSPSDFQKLEVFKADQALEAERELLKSQGYNVLSENILASFYGDSTNLKNWVSAAKNSGLLIIQVSNKKKLADLVGFEAELAGIAKKPVQTFTSEDGELLFLDNMPLSLAAVRKTA
jgi:hypothetical protein